jgi:hypothetical protein
MGDVRGANANLHSRKDASTQGKRQDPQLDSRNPSIHAGLRRRGTSVSEAMLVARMKETPANQAILPRAGDPFAPATAARVAEVAARLAGEVWGGRWVAVERDVPPKCRYRDTVPRHEIWREG